jgi:Zinc knuckle
MAPRNQPAGRAATDSGDSQTISLTDAQEALQAAQAEIERLQAQLGTQNPSAQSPIGPELVAVLEAIARQLSQAPSPADHPKRSAKITDPPILTDGIDPTFENWKLQLQDKLEVNADHFPTERARRAYVFSRTGGDAQTHLRPRYTNTSVNPFESAEDMIQHLASIYEDPFKVQNARLDYKALMMKPSEKFTEFQTKFLHLAGQAQIPEADLMPDLFDKLTLDLQRAVLPTYPGIRTLKELTEQCQALDQGLRRIKARAEQLKSKNQLYGQRRAENTPLQPVMDRKQSVKPAVASSTSLPVRTGSTEPPAWKPRLYQGKPDAQGKVTCFECHQEGHYASECPTRNAKPEVALVTDSYESRGRSEEESENEEP